MYASMAIGFATVPCPRWGLDGFVVLVVLGCMTVLVSDQFFGGAAGKCEGWYVKGRKSAGKSESN